MKVLRMLIVSVGLTASTLGCSGLRPNAGITLDTAKLASFGTHLRPAPHARSSVSEAQAIAAAGGYRGSGSVTAALAHFSDHVFNDRLVWVVMNVGRAPYLAHGPGPHRCKSGHGFCGPTPVHRIVTYHGFIFIDAQTGKYLDSLGY